MTFHKRKSVRPCKNVKYSHVCGQIENTLTSENTVDQRNTNKATVGIYSGKLIDHVIGILFITKQEFGYEDCKDVRDKCGDKRKQKSLYENGIIVGLIDHNDQNRVNKHQQKIGNGFASFFGNKPDSYADDANDKDNQHFYQLIKN